jgi:hypothetical protein
MPVQKIKSGRIITVQAPTYVGEKGIIFYDEDTPELRLSDGVTPGGILFGTGGTGTYVLVTATTIRLGGIKVGSGLSITGDGTLSAIATSTYILPIASTSTLGGIKIGANLSISLDGTLNANTSTAGVSDSFKTIKVNSQTDLIAVGADTIEFKAGNGIIIETSATSSPFQSLTITSTGFGNIDGGMFDTVFDTTTLMFDGGSP